MNKLIKLLRENLIIVIPAVSVSLIILGFIIFGFLDPATKHVDTKLSIIEEQYILETQFMEEYNSSNRTERSPYFVLDPYGVSPLSGLLMFETDEEKSYIILIKGSNEFSDIEFETDLNTKHFIPIYGLYADSLNQINIYRNEDGEKGEMVATKFISVGPVDERINETVLINTSYEYFQDDIMILTPTTSGLPVGYDYFGDVRWYLTNEYHFNPVLLQNGRILIGSDREYSNPYMVASLYEIDFLGKVYREYKIPGGFYSDALQLPTGNILTISSEYNGTYGDIIVEIDDNSGVIKKTWNLKDVLNKELGQAENWSIEDWFHAGSIDYKQESNEILITGVNQDIIISLDYTTKAINYIIGDSTNWTVDYTDNYFLNATNAETEWSYGSQDAIFTPEGIFVFDNGVNKSKNSDEYVSIEDTYSRGVLYKVDSENMTVSQVIEFGKDRGNLFYSPVYGNVQYLKEANYLVHSGGNSEFINDRFVYKSTTLEYLDGELVYELVIVDNFDSALHTSFYTERTKFISGRGVSVGEFTETSPVDDDLDLDFNFFETVPPRYEVTYMLEDGRLAMTGTFEETDEVYLILRNQYTDMTYYVPTTFDASSPIYSVELEENYVMVTYYINDAGISGYYELYLVINDTLYNTYKHIDFD